MHMDSISAAECCLSNQAGGDRLYGIAEDAIPLPLFACMRPMVYMCVGRLVKGREGDIN